MIEITNLTKSFGEKVVLNSFNATFKQGVTCIMGESGIGKTTLVNLILGLVKPDSGEIKGTEGRVVSCVFQENRLIEQLSAVKNVMLVCDKSKKAEVETLLCQMGLEDSLCCPVSTLSGGMKRRVAIVRAIINPADIYIFDEPFKELDDARKDKVIEIIKQHTQSAVTIFITHDVNDAKAMGGKIIKMK